MGSEKRFSNFLMTAIVALVTGAVLLISTGLYYYFNKRLKAELNDKLQAQKGQTELILANRLNHVKSKLKDLSLDNTIRVTMMLEVAAQLEERLQQSYSPENGMYFFVKSHDSETLYPEAYPGLSKESLKYALQSLPKGEFVLNGANEGLFWGFSSPIMRRTERLGTAYVVYDIAKDQEVLKTLQLTIGGGDIAAIRAYGLQCLMSDLVLPLSMNMQSEMHSPQLVTGSFNNEKPRDEPVIQSNFIPTKDKQYIFSRFNGFKNLYFVVHLENFIQVKRNVSLLVGFFSLLVMTLSATIAVFLGRQMSKPLKRIADKAIEISEGKKKYFFEIKNEYLEINLLSRSFNNMLVSIAEQKSRYEELLNNVDDAVYVIDEKGNIIETNATTYSQLGYAPEAFSRKGISDILPDNDASILLDLLDNKKEKLTSEKITLETWHRKANGQIIPVEINSRKITYEGKEVILNVARDLSSRKEAKKALRESEGKYRSILENIEECYFEVDLSGNLVFFNQATCDIWGYSSDELSGTNHWKLAKHESAEDLSAIFNSVGQTEKPARIERYKIITKNGDTKTIELSVSPLKDITGKLFGFRGVGRDITEHLRMEKEKNLLELQLQKGRRLEAIGTLAGGIAHDFNNLLAAVLGFTDLALLSVKKDDKLRENLEGIRKAGTRGKDLVAQILAFSRQSETKRRPVEITTIIKEALKMVAASSPATIEIRQNISDNGKILADPTQIHQVLMNLCTNAFHAMKGKGGVLEVNLAQVEISSDDLVLHPNLKEGKYLQLSVSDTGHGMDKQIMERIFEPFFTTKKTGEGSGMGMAVVHGIVKRHDGDITIKSREDKGTVFNIHFPIIDTAPDENEPVVGAQLRRGKEHILFVDDEEDLAKIGEQMLKYLGYEVEIRTSSVEALKAFQAKPNKFDAVITDQSMPNMTGVELAQEIINLRPDMPVILCTGFSETISEDKAAKLGIKKFLMKPLAIKDFSESLREVFEKQES